MLLSRIKIPSGGMGNINQDHSYGVFLLLKGSSNGFNQTVRVTPVSSDFMNTIVSSTSSSAFCAHGTIDQLLFLDDTCTLPTSIHLRHRNGWSVVDLSSIFSCHILQNGGGYLNFMISMETNQENLAALIPPTHATWYGRSDNNDANAPKLLIVSSPENFVHIMDIL